MSLVSYQRYIDFAKEHRGSSPKTIRNYQDAMKSCNLYTFDTEKVNDVWKVLIEKLEKGVSYSAIRLVFILTAAALRLEGLEVTRTYDYNVLEAKLKKCGTVPKGYTVEQAKQILKVMEKESLDLFRILVLQIYAGLRISACQGLDYGIFVKVEPHDVYCFPVVSKGKRYIAAISGYAYRLLQQTNYQKSAIVVTFDPNCKSPFDILYRKKFVYILKTHAMTDLLAGKSPFHSFRKLFAQLLAESKLDNEELGSLLGHSGEGRHDLKEKEFKKLLMGQAPDSVAYKHYIDKNDPGLYGKIAAIYAKTTLAGLKIYE